MIYADPSFLFSLYALDENSATAVETYQKERRRPLFLTPWQRFETQNAVRLATGRLRRAKQPLLFQTGNVAKTIQEDLSAGRLRYVEPDWRETMRLAEQMSEEHTEAAGSGAVDIWHVAAAVWLNAEVFWTFDQVQRGLVAATGRIRRVPALPTA